MLFKTRSASVYGIEAHLVDAEVNITAVSGDKNGEFFIVGLPDTAIRESRSRVIAAIRNSGFSFPYQRITVNLAPADVKKEGSAFDLPLAVAILGAQGFLNKHDLSDYLFAGELSLDGKLRPVRGVLSIAMLAREKKIPCLVVAAGNAREAAVVGGIEVHAMRTITEVVDFINGTRSPQPFRIDPSKTPPTDQHSRGEDFRDVRGQFHAKRAVEVAMAGGHNVLMVGPPGSGKTMLAKRIPSVLPPMSFEESLETTRIHSVTGLLPASTGLITERPFRHPHHTISDAGLVGGGAVPRPGEVSMAHNGVLFLDELPEFPRNVLEVMRQPLEERRVTIARAQMTLTFPAAFVLVAASNPCPCGFANDFRRECFCTPPQIQRYMSKISGPLMDRIDIQIDVPAVPYKELSNARLPESSEVIRMRVIAARNIQLRRFFDERIYTNAQMSPRHLRKYCVLTTECETIMENAVTKLGFSARGYDRILKVSRSGRCSGEVSGAEQALAALLLAKLAHWHKDDEIATAYLDEVVTNAPEFADLDAYLSLRTVCPSPDRIGTARAFRKLLKHHRKVSPFFSARTENNIGGFFLTHQKVRAATYWLTKARISAETLQATTRPQWPVGEHPLRLLADVERNWGYLALQYGNTNQGIEYLLRFVELRKQAGPLGTWEQAAIDTAWLLLTKGIVEQAFTLCEQLAATGQAAMWFLTVYACAATAHRKYALALQIAERLEHTSATKDNARLAAFATATAAHHTGDTKKARSYGLRFHRICASQGKDSDKLAHNLAGLLKHASPRCMADLGIDSVSPQ